jgi:hypothetical protein
MNTILLIMVLGLIMLALVVDIEAVISTMNTDNRPHEPVTGE